MKLPKTDFKVKIGPFDYEVMYSDDVAEEGDCFGSCHHDRQMIYLGPKYKQQKKDHTFIHEILHCCMWVAGISHRLEDKDKKVTEEDIVREVSTVMIQVIKDNPHIF